jgi:hypothetical protein
MVVFASFGSEEGRRVNIDLHPSMQPRAKLGRDLGHIHECFQLMDPREKWGNGGASEELVLEIEEEGMVTW